jgi:hypothetical protein
VPNALTSWKEIGHHLGKGVRTVQRWELEDGLPVRRPENPRRRAVVAFPEELDAWVRTRMKGPDTSVLESLSKELAALRGETAELRSRLECMENTLAAVDEGAKLLKELNALALSTQPGQSVELRPRLLKTRADILRSGISLAVTICNFGQTGSLWGLIDVSERAIQRARVTAQIARQKLAEPGYVAARDLNDLRDKLAYLESLIRESGHAGTPDPPIACRQRKSRP